MREKDMIGELYEGYGVAPLTGHPVNAKYCGVTNILP